MNDQGTNVRGGRLAALSCGEVEAVRGLVAEPVVRRALVARCAAEIKCGTYETPAKWDAAIARVQAELLEGEPLPAWMQKRVG